ncbi:putative scavenger receptor class B member 1-like [Apostichopus japonicus]|uniref:Putative scavenger receptor class B member 1-like n=1 Tax=Stichopus japonicus TaxID=307972 RepID=A0A2G8LRN5_STIJA|nr:putative scavenger receptor class B member 1-like [Apostichopus japonicus]
MKLCGHVTLGLTGAIFVVLGVILIPKSMNAVLQFMVKEIMTICPCSQLYPSWKEPTSVIPLYQTFYFLEIENPDEVSQGAKPKVKEVGPYVYNLTMHRDGGVWHLNDTVTYIQPIWYHFVESLSVSSDDRVITTINFPLVAAISSSRNMSSGVQHFLAALAQSTNSTLFRRLSIKEILWGYYDKFLHEAQIFAGKKVIPSDHFGFLMGRNGTSNGLYNAYTGAGNYKDVARIAYWNGTNSLNFWYSKWANMINGTDGTMFHPFIDKSEILYMFNPDTCRSLPYIFKEDAKYLDIPLHHYYLPPYVYANTTYHPENKEFCNSRCLFSGVFNISQCLRGAPLGLSNPHFLYGSQDLQESVEGLNPNVSLHENFFQVEPIMGMPYIFAERLQINLFVEPYPFLSDMQNVPSFYFPFLWLEEKVTVRTEDAMKYKSTILVINTVVFALKIGLSIFGGCLILAAGTLLTRKIVYSSRERSVAKGSKQHLLSRNSDNSNHSNSNNSHMVVNERSPLLPTI